MSTKYLDYDGLLYFWQKIKTIFAPTASPSLTGTPTAPTPTTGDSSTKIATTAFVAAAVSSHTSGVSGVKGDSETAYRTGNVNLTPANIGAAPTSHASSGTNYGKGNNSNYGHVKLSDSTSSTVSASSGGTAATPKAVSDALAAAKAYADGVVPSDFVGATSSAAGSHGLVPAPSIYDPNSVLFGNGGWDGMSFQIFSPSSSADLLLVLRRSTVDTTITPAIEIPCADTSTNGLMSSSDKSKLDSISMTNGVINSSSLPSFVDDVIEAYARSNQTELGSAWLATGSATGTVITPETGKIYVLMNDSTSYSANTQFRWGGTAYVKLADGGVSSITNAEIDVIVAS